MPGSGLRQEIVPQNVADGLGGFRFEIGSRLFRLQLIAPLLGLRAERTLCRFCLDSTVALLAGFIWRASCETSSSTLCPVRSCASNESTSVRRVSSLAQASSRNGAITFGQYQIVPAPGSQQFSTGLDLRPDINLAVKVAGNLNLATGVVTWKFTSLDPATLQPTTDPTAGFLPPDVTPPQGIGTLLYTVSPKLPLADGTTVCNQAVVRFDVNAPISTQNFCNTVDSTAPSSRVSALPSPESAPSFTVQWSGTDAGSGIADFTIYVSDNGGPFTAWLTNTALTQSVFTGTTGRRYGFYSIARDGVFNVEGSKSVADATTMIGSGSPACASDVSSQFTITQGGYRFNAATQRFVQVVTITRNAAGSLAGPFALAIKGLSATASLYNPAGTTSCIAPGSSYLLLNPGASWNSGQSLLVTLEFVDPTRAAFSYSPILLSGSTR